MRTKESRFDLGYEGAPTRVIRGRCLRPSVPPQVALPAVILLHGFKGFMDWGFFPLLAQGLAESGLQVVRFNASGSGVGADLVDFTDLPSFEQDTFTRQLEDIGRVHAHLVSGALGLVDRERIALLGHSRGGGLALLFAARQEVRALVTWAAIDSIQRFDDETLERWRKDGFLDIENSRTGQTMRLGRPLLEDLEHNAAALDILAAAKKVKAETLVLHGTADLSVDPKSAERIAQALPNKTLQLIEGAGHTFGATHPLREMTSDLERVLIATTQHLLEHL